MRAIGYQQPGTIDRTEALVDIELPDPNATGRDLLVEVKAVSVNPVDTKVRAGSAPFRKAVFCGPWASKRGPPHWQGRCPPPPRKCAWGWSG